MNIVIIGAGSFGTALGQVLAKNKKCNLWLLARKKESVKRINEIHINEQYFPNFKLEETLRATCKKEILSTADVIFLAIPSTVIIDYVFENKECINKNAVLVVLAKGLGKDNSTIVESLTSKVKNQVCSLKGPTFATDLIHNNPSAFTLASNNTDLFTLFSSIFSKTNIYLDFSTDILGVELTSALKNIYAIIIGIIDAYFNSANVRFMMLTKAFNEMKDIIITLGGKEETLFKYCGFGDFGLTALNDLSRNRTLGLLIGKGFLQNEITSTIILEGKRTLYIIYNKIIQTGKNYYLIHELYKLFNENYSIPDFITNLFLLISK